ncbi:TlpA family protein disulfide reductase [Thiomicrorhabdus arctica]|uniref:TlpA family protein disulfide reductase n=1 Tax=Thiomicrorhabdus arctica TaxID=131540 RepID=UPI00037E7C1A|nr:TlpA disulfide reductase family protein [Thiomicrorhabdus arctica]
MRHWFCFIGVLFCLSSAQASDSFNLPLDSGEEVTVNVYPATLGVSDQPLLIWFTEGYASRKPFKQLISQFNDLGYAFWQIDLLDSYFIESSPTNVRDLTGEGVAAVLQYASKQGKEFVPISTGRMSLVLLRGSRLWQLEYHPDKGIGTLKQVVTFFPNLFDAPKKAGDAPTLFPIVSATSLPILIVQPTQGTYKWKLPEVITALESSQSQVAIASVPNARDGYFLRREPTDFERKAGENIPEWFKSWLKAGQVSDQKIFKPVKNLVTKQATVSVKGLVSVAKRTAPDFELTDTAGNTIHLKEKRGKVILLNFWASWCGPCVKEIPSMNRLAKSFDADKFEIVSVNFKERPETISAFFKRVQVDFPVLMDLDGKIANQYEIFAFPSSFIIDAQGKLRYSVNAAIEWDDPQIKERIDSILK